jgi:hypothetical protein
LSVCPAPRRRKVVEQTLRTIGRHENVLENHVDAADALRASDLPGVKRLVVRARHQEEAPIGRTSRRAIREIFLGLVEIGSVGAGAAAARQSAKILGCAIQCR